MSLGDELDVLKKCRSVSLSFLYASNETWLVRTPPSSRERSSSQTDPQLRRTTSTPRSVPHSSDRPSSCVSGHSLRPVAESVVARRESPRLRVADGRTALRLLSNLTVPKSHVPPVVSLAHGSAARVQHPTQSESQRASSSLQCDVEYSSHSIQHRDEARDEDEGVSVVFEACKCSVDTLHQDDAQNSVASGSPHEPLEESPTVAHSDGEADDHRVATALNFLEENSASPTTSHRSLEQTVVDAPVPVVATCPNAGAFVVPVKPESSLPARRPTDTSCCSAM